MRAGIGKSRLPDAKAAGKEAALLALKDLGGAEADLILVFASSRYDQMSLISGVSEGASKIKMIGCSTAGEITGQGQDNGSVVVAAISGGSLKAYVGYSQSDGRNNLGAGMELARNLMEQSGKISSMMILPDGLAGNGMEFVRGIQKIMGKRTMLVGGTSGDDFQTEKTYQYIGNKILSGSIVGAGFAGSYKMGMGLAHGWLPVGLGRTVTRASGNRLIELDHRPAIEIYSDYMGDGIAAKLKGRSMISVKEGSTRPLGINKGNGRFLIRQPFFADEDGSLVLAAEVEEGDEIFFMLGDQESVIESARLAAQTALEQLHGIKPELVLVFSCGARSLVLGDRTSDQISAVKEIMGGSVPMAGFVCYGEIAPWPEDMHNGRIEIGFHNEVIIVYALA